MDTRIFSLITKPWSKGLEVYVFEYDTEVGVTQTEGSTTEGAVLSAASGWVQAQFGLTDDEFSLIYPR